MKAKLIFALLTFPLLLSGIFISRVAYADDINENQMIIADPDGGGYFYSLDGSSEFSDSDIQQVGGVVMSVSEYEMIQEKKDAMVDGIELFAPISLYSTNPFNKPTKVIPNRLAYTSNPFSGNGWRFSGYRFLPASGTGVYLAWRVEGDAGRVGTYDHARNTYNGHIQGVPVDPGQRKYVASDSTGLLFYTYNPVPGSRYIVENW